MSRHLYCAGDETRDLLRRGFCNRFIGHFLPPAQDGHAETSSDGAVEVADNRPQPEGQLSRRGFEGSGRESAAESDATRRQAESDWWEARAIAEKEHDKKLLDVKRRFAK